MIEIEGPDGVIYEFPEGTDETTMLNAMRGVYGGVEATEPAEDDASWLDTIGDAAGAFGAGVVRGGAALAGLPGTVGDLVDQGLTSAGQYIGIIPDDWSAPTSSLSGQSLVSGLGQATGGLTDYKGESVPAQFAGTVGEFLPGAAAFGGLSPSNLAMYGAVPGVASEAAGQITEGTAAEPYARVAAALAAPIAAQGVANLGRRIISPNAGADPVRLALAQTLDDAGVPISAGQRVGNEALRRKEGITTGGQNLMGEQAGAFTEAALKTAGISAKRATPEVMAKAADDIGQVFDDIVRGVDVVPDAVQAQKAIDASKLAFELSPDKLPPLLKNVENRLLDAATGGSPIQASVLKQWRSNLSKLTRSADAATREGAASMLDAVDDAMAATLTKMGRADDVARLAQARSDWRNLLALEKAVGSAGENAAAGLISPSALRNAVKTQGTSSYVRGGRGDIGELARAGEGVMKALPNSGTPAGMSALGFNPQNIMTAVGGGLGATAGGPFGAVAGALAGSAYPAVSGAIRMSPVIQRYLANQAVGPTTVGALSRPSVGRASIAALLAEGMNNANQ